METLKDFAAMGGYAVYVWGAYGLSVLVLGWMTGLSLHQAKAARARLQALEAARAASTAPGERS